MDEITLLKNRIEHLERIVGLFVRGDRYVFDKDVIINRRVQLFNTDFGPKGRQPWALTDLATVSDGGNTTNNSEINTNFSRIFSDLEDLQSILSQENFGLIEL